MTTKGKSKRLHFRLSIGEAELLEQAARESGFGSASLLSRHITLQQIIGADYASQSSIQRDGARRREKPPRKEAKER